MESRMVKPYDWLLKANINISHFPPGSSLPSRLPHGVRLLPLPPVHPKPFKCGLPNSSNTLRSSNSAESKRRLLPELIQRKSTEELLTFDCTSYVSSKWEMCLRCHDLTDSSLALSMEYAEHRVSLMFEINTWDVLIPSVITVRLWEWGLLLVLVQNVSGWWEKFPLQPADNNITRIFLDNCCFETYHSIFKLWLVTSINHHAEQMFRVLLPISSKLRWFCSEWA